MIDPIVTKGVLLGFAIVLAYVVYRLWRGYR